MAAVYTEEPTMRVITAAAIASSVALGGPPPDHASELEGERSATSSLRPEVQLRQVAPLCTEPPIDGMAIIVPDSSRYSMPIIVPEGHFPMPGVKWPPKGLTPPLGQVLPELYGAAEAHGPVTPTILTLR
ncbi:hypothetical protein ACFL6X_02585 [Candidatus Latescibacterota bacterium]